MKFRLHESLSTEKICTLYYDDIEVTTKAGYDYESGPWYDTEEVSWEYNISEQEAAEVIADCLVDDLSEDDYNAIVGPEQDDDKLMLYIEEHFDDLWKKYEGDLLDHFKDAARDDANENWEPDEPDYDDWDD